MEAASFLQHEAPAAHWVVRVWVQGLPTCCSYGEHSQFSYHRTHHCLHVYLGVSQAVFATKGTALAPGGSSSCLSTAARSWGRFGTPDENGKAKATFQKLRGTQLWGEKLSPSKGAKFSPAKDLGAQISCHFLTAPNRTWLWASYQHLSNGMAAAAPCSAWIMRNTKNVKLTCF